MPKGPPHGPRKPLRGRGGPLRVLRCLLYLVCICLHTCICIFTCFCICVDSNSNMCSVEISYGEWTQPHSLVVFIFVIVFLYLCFCICVSGNFLWWVSAGDAATQPALRPVLRTCLTQINQIRPPSSSLYNQCCNRCQQCKTQILVGELIFIVIHLGRAAENSLL